MGNADSLPVCLTLPSSLPFHLGGCSSGPPCLGPLAVWLLELVSGNSWQKTGWGMKARWVGSFDPSTPPCSSIHIVGLLLGTLQTQVLLLVLFFVF